MHGAKARKIFKNCRDIHLHAGDTQIKAQPGTFCHLSSHINNFTLFCSYLWTDQLRSTFLCSDFLIP